MNPASVAMGPWLPGQYVARGSLDTTVYSQLSSQAVHSLTELRHHPNYFVRQKEHMILLANN